MSNRRRNPESDLPQEPGVLDWRNVKVPPEPSFPDEEHPEPKEKDPFRGPVEKEPDDDLDERGVEREF